jgi:hypothetical protein
VYASVSTGPHSLASASLLPCFFFSADKVADAVLRKLDHTLPAVVLTPSGERLRAAATRRERIARGHAQPDDLNLPRRVVVYLRHRSRESLSRPPQRMR